MISPLPKDRARAEHPPIALAYSVDADDAFMFHALASSGGADAALVDTRGFRFTHQRADTAALNELAARGGADVVAISLGAYPGIADRYLLLPHGASVGRGFGPVLIARQPMAARDLRGKRVGIPGLTTTAYLLLRLIEPQVVPVVVPIAPFSRIFASLDAGEIDAALLIHEGRLLYEARGYHKVVELGEWWEGETKLPLPLGVNVIRRALGADVIAALSEVLRASITWAIDHRNELIPLLAGLDRGDPALRDEALVDRYLGMYANQDTREMAPDVRRAIDEVFTRARANGLLPAGGTIGWAP